MLTAAEHQVGADRRPASVRGGAHKRHVARLRATPAVDLAESPSTPGRVSAERVTVDPELGLAIAP
jgi:hypothetical protein